MPTIVTGRDGSVQFGVGLPTVIIGERINPTGRKKLAAALVAGNLGLVEQEARNQRNAGAQILDVNVGAPGVKEEILLPRAVELVAEVSGLPICIDSASPEALRAALEVYPHKALINSVTGEERSLSTVLPFVRDYGAAVIGLTIDDDGIPSTAARRVEVAEKIVETAESLGIPRENVVIDCLVLAVSANPDASLVTLEALRTISGQMSVSTAMGVSNISFGMPERMVVNSAFLSMAIEAGLSAAIVNPANDSLLYTILSSNLLMGRDEFAANFLSHYRSRRAV